MNKTDKWWADLTVAQKERIAGKIAKKNGLNSNTVYPYCTILWNTLRKDRKDAIMRHCTDDHGVIIEEWKEGDSFSY